MKGLSVSRGPFMFTLASMSRLSTRTLNSHNKVHILSISRAFGEVPFDKEAAAKAKARKELSILPYMARPLVQESKVVDHPKGASGVTAHIPEEQLKRKVRIYQQARNPMSSATHKYKPWSVQLENQPKWKNGLMGYASGADPLAASGLAQIKFETADQAIAFVTKQGWDYEIARKVPKPSFEGKKQYAQNFLNYHVANRRAKMSPKQFSKFQYDHPERGQTSWVNLKFSNYGDKESKMVSQTHWNPEHPNNHNASNWRYDNLKKSQELSRKLGK
uniref:NADH dehydrogenase [ubiquinone] iron-sulfur protein 4, mitochondrial n=1 Tax=Aplanochytrium stocchinoi TaxID=215587 RepID=A0A7S3PFH5_9STRA|mmetsp:Transcript_11483/g.14299  ORF Transcript_11483/g.14299 Transcript_11483/m.14299 type:complete len:275 (-) Transcript_11483:775-1599(-)